MDNQHRIPLAEKMRPTKLNEVIGQSHLIGKNGILRKIIENKEPISLIFWGPAGTGKTTLSRILATEVNADFIEISAVTSGKKISKKLSNMLDKTGILEFEQFYSLMKSTASINLNKMLSCRILKVD